MKKTILDDDTDSYQAAEGENESDQTNPLLMKTILSNVASGITAVILRGNSAEYLYSNDQFYRMLKYTREQFQEKTSDIYTIFHPDDRERIRAAVNSLKPNDAPLTIEYRAICRDNSIIYVRMVIAALRYRPEDSEIQVSIFEDITEEHKEMERQRELIENLPCGAGMYDISDGTIRTLYVNKRYLELVGRKQEDIVISALDVVMPEDREHLRGKIRKLVADGKDQESELHILNSNGHYIPFLIHCSILHQRSDTTTIYVTYTSIADDVLTFRHMLPVALETMMSASMDLSFIKDSALTYVCASRAFAEMAGYQNEKDLIGKTDYDIFTREFADCYRADDRKLIESGQSLVDYIERIPMKDGRVRYSNTSKYLLRDSMGNIIGLYGIGRDVTENREAFDRLKMLTDSIPGGLATYELSPSGIRSLYLSDGIFPIVGYSKNDDSNRFNNPLNFIVEEDKAELYRQLDRIWKISTPVDCYFRIRRKDRTLRWINFRAKIAERNEDRVIINAVLFDVHEQKEASLKLSEAEHQNKMRYEHELQLRSTLSWHFPILSFWTKLVLRNYVLI